MGLLHSTRLALPVAALALTSAVGAQAPPPSTASASSFTVFFRSVRIGSEQIAVARSTDGWTITSTGRIGAPIDVVTKRLQIRYDPDWKPLELTIDATSHGQALSVRTTVSGTTATSAFTRAGQPAEKSDTIAADAVLLRNPFFAAYEAVAARLKTAATGSTIPAYGVPHVSVAILVGDSSTEQIQTTERLVEARRTHLTLVPAATAPPIEADIWTDENWRLLRLSVPASNLEVAREDLASVAARRVIVSRAGDEYGRIPANGFTLVGTLSKPTGAGGKSSPAVVLVGGSGPTDRDGMVAGIPVLGQLANALADAGILVLRYDKRGVGQSGGRTEAATLADFADDLRAVVKFMKDRKDVDPKRLAVVGHSEGGAVAMLAAAKDKRIRALVLLGAPGTTGAAINIEQIEHRLDRSNLSDPEKQSLLELQKKIQAAVLAGSGWEGVSREQRRAADTPWFQSFLSYDPAKVMPRVRQPLLIVQGMLDTQVDPSNADRLEALAKARKKKAPVEVVKISGVNHLLVAATTGEVDEYPSLTDKHISPAVAPAIADWLQKTLAATK